MKDAAREWVRHNCRFAMDFGIIDQAIQEGTSLTRFKETEESEATKENYPNFSKRTVEKARADTESLDKLSDLPPEQQAALDDMLRQFDVNVSDMGTAQEKMEEEIISTSEEQRKRQKEEAGV